VQSAYSNLSKVAGRSIKNVNQEPFCGEPHRLPANEVGKLLPAFNRHVNGSDFLYQALWRFEVDSGNGTT
jgi:hypothetical protein